MTQIVALMGSYRRGGAIDRAVDAALAGAESRGAVVRKVVLEEARIEFCRNCRGCMQEPGTQRGRCVLEDDLEGLLGALERADGVVLAAPVNVGDVNALTRRLLERMCGYGYWPAGAAAPRVRSRTRSGPALLITSSAAPAWMTRTLMQPVKTLRRMARMMGRSPVGSLVVDLQGDGRGPSAKQLAKARRLGAALVGRGVEPAVVPGEARAHATV